MTSNQQREKEWLEKHLKTGARNAINVNVLARSYGISVRAMNELVKRARDNDLPVIAVKNTESRFSGLFLPEFDFEAYEWLALSYNEIASRLRTTDNVSNSVVKGIRAGRIKKSCPAISNILPPAIIVDILKEI